MSRYNTIIASGEGDRYEYTAESVVVPGDIISLTSTPACVANTVADARVAPMFAIENEIFGRGINLGSGYTGTNGLVDYAIGDRVYVEHCRSGMTVNANIAAGAAAIVHGDYITSGATGSVKKGTAANAFALAMEAVDQSAAVAPTRIQIRIM